MPQVLDASHVALSRLLRVSVWSAGSVGQAEPAKREWPTCSCFFSARACRDAVVMP